MKLSLKWALIFSVLIHVSLFALRPLIWPAGPASSHPIEITYIVPPAPVRTEPRFVRMPAEPAVPVRTPAPRVERSEPRTAAPADKPAPELKQPVSVPVPPPTPAPEVLIPKAAASNIPESSFAEIEYKRLIRQHLKNHLLYPGLGLEGAVRIQVVLDGEGMLKQAEVMEASDPRLADAALEGVRAAVPYPRFPRKLKDSPPQLEFLVQYRGDDLDSS